MVASWIKQLSSLEIFAREYKPSYRWIQVPIKIC